MLLQALSFIAGLQIAIIIALYQILNVLRDIRDELRKKDNV